MILQIFPNLRTDCRATIVSVLVSAFLLTSYGNAEPSPLGYLPVAGTDVALKKEPNLHSPKVSTIAYGDIVTIVDPPQNWAARAPKIWIFVELDQEGSKTRGWVLKTDLALPENFQALQSSDPTAFRFSVVDHYAVVSVTPNGRYSYKRAVCLSSGYTIEKIRQDCSASSGIFEENDSDFYEDCSCTTAGPLFRYREVYWLRKADIFWIQNESASCVFYPAFPYCITPTNKIPNRIVVHFA